jgi:hypothetical protein
MSVRVCNPAPRSNHWRASFPLILIIFIFIIIIPASAFSRLMKMMMKMMRMSFAATRLVQ